MARAPVIEDSLCSVDGSRSSGGTRAGSGNHDAVPVVKTFRSDDGVRGHDTWHISHQRLNVLAQLAAGEPTGASRDLGNLARHLGHDERRARMNRGPSAPALDGDDLAVDQNLPAPDTPDLAASEGALETSRTHHTLRADRL